MKNQSSTSGIFSLLYITFALLVSGTRTHAFLSSKPKTQYQLYRFNHDRYFKSHNNCRRAQFKMPFIISKNSPQTSRRNVRLRLHQTSSIHLLSLIKMDWILPSALETMLIKRILFAGLVGCIVGLERRQSQNPAGFRTMTLVAVGACIFTITSVFGFEACKRADQARVAAGVASGVGFIGAGVITRAQRPGKATTQTSEKGKQINTQEVRGLTTAAAIWISAALGMACGVGLQKISFYGAGITILIMRAAQIVRATRRFFVKRFQNICSTKFAQKPLPREEVEPPQLYTPENTVLDPKNLSDIAISQAALERNLGKIAVEMDSFKSTEKDFGQMINPFFDNKNLTSTFISLSQDD